MSSTNLIPGGGPGLGHGLGRLLRGLATLLLFALASALAPHGTAAADPPPEAALVIGHRTIVVFRAPLGALLPADRAEDARRRILRAFAAPGEGWTSVKPQDPGVMVEIDGQPLFLVLAGDVARPGEETPDGLANAASRVLQAAWADARAARDPRANVTGAVKVLLAAAVLAVALVLIWTVSRRLRDAVTSRLARHVQALPEAVAATRLPPVFLGVASHACVLLAWLLSLLVLFVFLAFSLDQFATTRALGEGLLHGFSGLLLKSLTSVAEAVPGMFVAVIIFLAAWLCTRVSGELFEQVASGRLQLGMLDAHTAPATRRIVNASLWLFALAMAYPYLPGAQTEAFKGLSVILGIMVSIGASGLVGQVASGVMLVYTRALSLGEYVRIQECEGTVTEIGLFVTRLRTGMGVEVALPNSLVIGNVTHNFSRQTADGGCVLETAITIGYDTPWRQVHALLTEAAASVPAIAREPAPFVVQTALQDAYVAYRLVVHVGAREPDTRAMVQSDLHAAIQDQFNRYGVQIMSPSYYDDPAEPKIVPESKWYTAPAKLPGQP